MLEKLKEKWDEILLYMKEEFSLSDVTYKTWLLPLKPYSVEYSAKQSGNTIRIITPDSNFLGYISKRYGFQLKVSIEEIAGIKGEIEFIVMDDIEKENSHANRLINNGLSPVKRSAIQNANLNPKYTFDTFVVGANNNLAHAAALAVAETPGEIYNPLFIYGGVGLGKTHLMHSIANFILQKNPEAKVMYVTSEKFTNELIDAIRNKNNISTTEFRNKYRHNDVLLIDDIQFIIGKESTQEEFFYTFNEMYEARKQIIISSDKPPKEIETLEERLRSRFEWGLTVDIQSPDYETRMAILRKKEELEGLNIDNEVIKYIATNIKSNIRELEGALTKVVAFSVLKTKTKKDITVPLAEEALKDMISQGGRTNITPDYIIEIVADHFDLTPLDITSQKRSKNVVYPRQICMYLCRTMTQIPLQQIGKYMGGRDHTTVMHGYDKICRDLENNPALSNTIDILTKKINPRK